MLQYCTMQINHNYISFHSERYTDGDPVYHGQFFQIRQTQACSCSMHRFGKFGFLFYVPAVRIVSGYPVFSTSAVSAFSSRKVFLSFPDIRKQSHLPSFLTHTERFPLQFFCQALYSDVLHMPIFPASDAIHVPAEIFGSVPAHGTSGLCHWES